MWKWLLKQAIKALAEPIIDAVIEALENLSRRTQNTIDDAFVAKFREFKEAIVGFILAHCDIIVKKA